MKTEEFQSWYCEWWSVPPAEFHAIVLRRTLYPQARLLAVLLRHLDRQFFQADHDFIEDVGHIRNAAGFADAVQAYVDHFSNRRFLRHRLRLRVSVRRMWRLVREVMTEDPPSILARKLRAPDSFTPFSVHEEETEADSP